jgi:hypothetical protein
MPGSSQTERWRAEKGEQFLSLGGKRKRRALFQFPTDTYFRFEWEEELGAGSVAIGGHSRQPQIF